MTWTYNPDWQDDKDEVRFWIGDTSAEAVPPAAAPAVPQQRAQDEEINAVLTDYPDPKSAAAEICEALASKYALLADASVGDVRESFSQIAKAFEARASKLRARTAITASPKFGGLSKSEKQALDENTDAVQPSFRIGLGDNPELPSERDGRFDLGTWDGE